MTGRSNALRWSVNAPRGPVYLTGLQWSLWWLLSRPRRSWSHGDLTLTKLSTLTGSSRGRCWHALSRLRSLELVSWRAWPAMPLDPERRPRRYSPGCRGRLLVWIPKAARDARLAGPPGGPRRTPIDSVSGPFGTYLAREGLEAAWRRRKSGAGARPSRPSAWPDYPGDADTARRPRRGPPRVLYARCPSGHRLRAGRRSWIEGPSWAPSLSARFEGRCRLCAADVVELVTVTLPPPPPRGLSDAELTDPATLAGRIDSARRLLDDPSLHPAVREQLRRDYTDRPPGYTGRWPTPVFDRAGELLRRARLGPEPVDAEARVDPDAIDRPATRGPDA